MYFGRLKSLVFNRGSVLNLLNSMTNFLPQSDVNPTLPHRDKDTVLTLYSHSFLASELMFKNYKKLIAKMNQNSRLSQGDSVDMSIYFCTWLGFLYETAKGFNKLVIRKLVKDARPHEFNHLIPLVNKLGKFINKHSDPLRKLRNDVFHMPRNNEAIVLFLRERPDRLDWAEELQAEFAIFSQNIEFFVIFTILSRIAKRK